MASEPYQLMNGPFEVWTAPTVEIHPDVATPSASIGGNWTLMGISGDKDITEDGITIMVEQDVQKFRGLGSIATRKMFRTSQDVVISFTLADASIENYSDALDLNPVSNLEWRRRIQLLMSADVAQQSLLIRGDGKSPYGDFNTQWWIPRASHDAPLETKIVKGEPIGLAFRFTALVDDTYDLGHLESQDEAS